MIKLGVIGLGEVSQLMHLPILQDLTESYKVTAVSDVAPSLVNYIQKKYHIAEGYLNAVELIEKADIDAVLILSPDQYHGEYAARALKAGKHVFVEKPVTLCSGELAELIELKKEYPDQIVMVGYMRRYAGPFLKAKEILEAEPKPTEYLRFRDIILEGPFFIGQTRPIFYPTDVPEEAIKEGNERRRAHLDRAIGADASDDQRTTYQMMSGLGCHSFSAVRELFGTPKKIHSVTTAVNGQHVVIVMEFAGFLATYELVNNQEVVQFDAAIEVFQKNRKLHIKYETPYIRYQPASLEVIESTDTETKTTNYGPDFRDAFQTELNLFAECIKTGKQPKTILEDAVDDLKLFEEIIRVMGRS
ncbi:Gfo/Idh/MocA family protein [Ohessyouella blattaphilus]|uniref:Gfo/Idh/MocA family oxidoreductase n=1 Tax=Ohessyouella blattaphilus TaxID=2949333 RepID=A0ABT1EFT9_9FIRM|nr:Gfo/Idh/MocA family oxidoreductase [Ohessyouella blattaphilus]MCP1109513.1 Gfo/Idh/MocA family oxidoreductase [Ohessyouella blattaphilus]MCR8562907.1 Gfo/Idh/MocA family oxidoreductase [Ohessyouella blattaphilus]MDL2250099.1 Gfo/Idh/MocA family oxidoreductase [Lachnospiraceae bacterium OttesenSCG-928-J05]